MNLSQHDGLNRRTFPQSDTHTVVSVDLLQEHLRHFLPSQLHLKLR